MNIEMIENSGYAVVTALADFNPLSKLGALSNELKALNYSGNVIFDLLITNGTCENRFASILFTGNSFDRKSFHIVSDIDTSLKIRQDDFFRSNPHLLLSSVLSKQERNSF